MSNRLLPRAPRSRVLALVITGIALTAVGAVAHAAGTDEPQLSPGKGGPQDLRAAETSTIGTIAVDGHAFEIKDFSFGVENPTTIGSATGGAGAGKIKFNEFTIKRAADQASLPFFENFLGTHQYDNAVVVVRKAGGDPRTSGAPYLTFRFSTVFTTKIDWSGPGDEGPEESVTFVYGGLEVAYLSGDGGVSSTGVIDTTR